MRRSRKISRINCDLRPGFTRRFRRAGFAATALSSAAIDPQARPGTGAAVRRRATRTSTMIPPNSSSRRQAPKRRGVPGQPRLEQHEFAVARDEEIEHLRVAVAGFDPLAHQHAQIVRERRFRNRRSIRSGTPCSAIPWTARARALRAPGPTAFRRAARPGAATTKEARPGARACAQVFHGDSLRRLRRRLPWPSPAAARRRAAAGPTATGRRRRT